MAEIVTKFSSDDKEMTAAFQRQQREIAALTGKLREMKDGGVATSTSIAASVQNMVSSYVGMHAAINMVNRALQDQIDLQNKAAAVQKTAADMQRQFLINVGNVGKQEQDRLLAEVSAISARTGVSQQAIYQMGSTAMSAKGGMSGIDAMRSVEAAARVTRGGAAGQAVSGGLLDAASLTGSTDPMRNLGLLVSMQQQARNVTMESVSKHLIPGAIAVKSYGGTTEESVAALTAMTQAMKDREGSRAATVMKRLAQQVEGVTTGGFGEDIAKLRSDPRLRDRFLSKASFEGETSFVKSFLTSGSESANLYDKYKREIPNAEAAAGTAKSFLNRIDSPALQRAEGFRQKFETKAESAREADLRSGNFARIRGAIEETASSTGVGYFERTFNANMSYVRALARRQGAEEAGIDQIDFLQSDIANNRKSGFTTAADAQKQLAALEAIKSELSAIRRDKGKNINAHGEN